MKEMYKFKMKDGEQEVEVTFMEPSKAVSREGEIVYASTQADCIRKGLLSNREALKYANQHGGVLTEEENDVYLKSLAEFIAKEKEIADAKAKGEPTEALETEFKIIRDRILFFQNKHDTIFELTAETKARDALLLHYALALVYRDGKPIFEGKDYASRMKNLEDRSTPFKDEVLKRAVWYATALYYGVKDLNEAKYPEPSGATAS